MEYRRHLTSATLLLLALLISSCSSAPSKPTIADIPAFALTTESGQQLIAATDAASAVDDIALLQLSPAMRQFADRHIPANLDPIKQLQALNYAVKNPQRLGLQYHYGDTLTAQQTFEQRRGNCFGYANLFIALSRYRGIDAHYQLIKNAPQWSPNGELVEMNVHLNALVEPLQGRHYVLDIDAAFIANTHHAATISDQQAKALFFSNLAMQQLALGHYLAAYQQQSKAISLWPQQGFLWSNLASILDHNQQTGEAISSYQLALQLDPALNPAMNNLARIYQRQGDIEQAQHYYQKIAHSRQKNPFYYYSLAQQAFEQQDFDNTIEPLKKAIRLDDTVADFHWLLSKAYLRDNQLKQSRNAIEQALSLPALTLQRQKYQQQLTLVQRQLER